MKSNLITEKTKHLMGVKGDMDDNYLQSISEVIKHLDSAKNEIIGLLEVNDETINPTAIKSFKSLMSDLEEVYSTATNMKRYFS